MSDSYLSLNNHIRRRALRCICSLRRSGIRVSSALQIQASIHSPGMLETSNKETFLFSGQIQVTRNTNRIHTACNP